MKRVLINCVFIALIISLAGCEENLLKEKYENTTIDNYELFWSEYDLLYGAFEAKNINWNSLHDVYLDGLDDNSTDLKLFNALSGLLNELNDGHADLTAPGVGYFRSWNRRNKSLFSDLLINDFNNVNFLFSKIKTNYLEGKFKSGEYSDNLFFWGIIPFNSRKIGYIYFPTFSIDDYPSDFIQEAVDSFNMVSDGVIIDLRYNGGGRTEAFVSSLNSFANERKLFMKSKFRNGPSHSDFTKLEEHWTNPHSDCLKKIPVAILMNSYSASSSEHFIIGMKSQSNVITVGDTTCGAFSAVLERVMKNGWKFRLGAQVVYTPEGKLMTDDKGNYLEGIGIKPDYYETDKWRAVMNNNDLPIEKALTVLTSNN
ncbi:MAG: hypothetical protein KA807_07045 [Prolixibacteraceae bacterium]|nr:hypothetical protein [Prolixibacteraceae bacterium]